MDLTTPGYTLLELLAALVAGFVAGRLTAGAGDPRVKEAKRQQQRAADLSVREAVHGLPPDVRAKIERLIAEDRIIEAIRDFRAATQLGLKEAKDAIDMIRGRAGPYH